MARSRLSIKQIFYYHHHHRRRRRRHYYRHRINSWERQQEIEMNK